MNLKEEITELFKSLTEEYIKANLKEILHRVNQANVYKIKDLITDNGCDCVPKNEPGVYFVGRESDHSKLTLCTAKELGFSEVKIGWYDKKINILKEKLTSSQSILYIGKANNLKTRVNEYMKFVRDMVNEKETSRSHRGGRAICHIKEVCKLNFCWISLKDLKLNSKTAEDVEKALIKQYQSMENHNKYPFANWRL